MYVGKHVKKEKDNMYDSILSQIIEYNMNTVQIFVAVPQNYNIMNEFKYILKLKNKPKITSFENDIQTYIPLLTKKCNINTIISKSNLNISDKDKQILQNNLPIKLFVHSSYMSYAWCSPKLYKKTMTFIKNQYIISCYINAVGLIIHMPTLNKYILYKNKPYTDLLKLQNQYGNMFVKNKNTQHIKCKILFETNSCLPKNSLYYNNISILNKFKNIVLDTSHIWACGIDISSNILAKQFLNELNPNNIKLIHFNDNHYDLGSGKDEHNNLFKGKIWSKYRPKITPNNNNTDKLLINIDNYRLQNNIKNINNIKNSGVYEFIKYAKLYNIPIIFERNIVYQYEFDLCLKKY